MAPLQPIIGEQPTLPPGGKLHPPLQPTVPCETQAAITDLVSPVGPVLRLAITGLPRAAAAAAAASASSRRAPPLVAQDRVQALTSSRALAKR